jgi:hypothetical protein
MKGEAWKFRQKTDEELKLEAKLNISKQEREVPKIIETIKLIKASKNREKPFINTKLKIELAKPSVTKTQSPLLQKKSSNLSRSGTSRKLKLNSDIEKESELETQNSPQKMSGFFQLSRQNSRNLSEEKTTNFKRSEGNSEKNSPLLKRSSSKKHFPEENSIFSNQRKQQVGAKDLKFSKIATSSSKDSNSPRTPKGKIQNEGSPPHRSKMFFGSSFPDHRDKDPIEESKVLESSNLVNTQSSDQNIVKKKFQNSLLSKISQNRDILNFENDYFSSLVKSNLELTRKYIRDHIIKMRFDRRFSISEVIEDIPLNFGHFQSSALAYTDVHILVLDSKGYEIVFASQLEEVQEKLNYFGDYFKGIKFDQLKKIAFLFEEKKYRIGETIYKENDSTDNLYFVKSGELHVNLFYNY